MRTRENSRSFIIRRAKGPLGKFLFTPCKPIESRVEKIVVWQREQAICLRIDIFASCST